MKPVLFTFPVLNGQVDVRFMDALLNTVREGLSRGINIVPYFVTDDALIQRVRNDIFHVAYTSGIEDCIFVDSDIVWAPEDVFKLLLSPYDVVGATYRKKDENIAYVGIDEKSVVENGYIETDSLGMGFVKINSSIIKQIYESSPRYLDVKSGEYKRAVFQVDFSNEVMVSEDVYMFRKLKELGIKTYVDTSINLGHIGRKVYQSNLKEYLK